MKTRPKIGKFNQIVIFEVCTDLDSAHSNLNTKKLSPKKWLL
ncbi:hypothetical protein GPUN_0215 [Glaciecola punicea ACAM 611]|uniref:Uncharacterized protein n=1 Tax=Glaciecola punicea ACAM 611 TaxID=1121923 RepID=H5T7U2_9ALTE|nr:hypothetical protein GPUN_0215 [Glaciecola punicea ACAM 611]